MIKEINGINGKYKSVQIHTDYNENDIYYFGYRYSEDGKITKAEITEDKYKEICLDCENFLKKFTDRINENEKIIKNALEKKEIFDYVFDYYLKLKEQNLEIINILIEKTKNGEIYFDFKVFEEYVFPLFGSLNVYEHLHHLLYDDVKETWVPRLKQKQEMHRRDGTYSIYKNYGVLEPSRKTYKLYKLAKEILDDDYNYIVTQFKENLDLDKALSVDIPKGTPFTTYSDEKILQRHKNILSCLEFLYEKTLTCEYYVDFSVLWSGFYWDKLNMQQIYETICDIICNLKIIEERLEPLPIKKTNTRKTSTNTTKKENTTSTQSIKKDDKPVVQKKIYNNGDVYEGEFLNGKRHGNGKYKYSNGDIYKGEFKDGSFTGNGEYYFAKTGDRFNGNFKNGKFCGNGTIFFSDGAIYDGMARNGQPHGYGELTFINGDSYKGLYEKGQRSIFGRYNFANGDWIIGEIKNNKFNGFGAKHYADLSVEVGYFKDDILDKTRDYIQGESDDLSIQSVIHKPKFSYLSNGKGYYFGQSRGITPYGFGIQVYLNGNMYIGNFLNDNRNGSGIFITNNGAYYIGEFINDNFHGKGKVQYVEGIIREGTFINGKLNGKVKEYDENGEFVGEFNFINGEKE